jgi:UDP-4-amino-4,6-dideoxy-N-acetyl-beta-L-altrosamine transaminase
LISYGRQSIDQADIDAVVAVLGSDYLTQGPRVAAFEQALAGYLAAGSDSRQLHTVAANSATSVLHLACMALDVGPGDTVWTCANSFAASANCARYCGAQVDFIDIDPATLNISVDALAEKLAQARVSGRLPKAVIPVAFGGRSAPLREIRRLADTYGFAIIEDASHAVGSLYQGTKVGAHGLSDITVFSFHPVKIITTAEGGMAVTHNAALARRMARLRTHGITRDPAEMQQPGAGAWHYEQQELGYNYRLTDLQAALGSSQITRIDKFISARHQVRIFYSAAFADLVAAGKLLLPPQDEPDSGSALHLYPVQIPPSAKRGRREVFDALRAAGIGVNVHYMPIYLHPYYRRLGFELGLCPAAETYYSQAISLPMHPELDAAQLEHVSATVHKALA